VVELRQTQAVIQDKPSRQLWSVPCAGVTPGSANRPTHAPAPSARAQREEFFIGDTVGFIDKHLSERVGIIVRLNAKAASITGNDSEGHWRVPYAMLRKTVDSEPRRLLNAGSTDGDAFNPYASKCVALSYDATYQFGVDHPSPRFALILPDVSPAGMPDDVSRTVRHGSLICKGFLVSWLPIRGESRIAGGVGLPPHSIIDTRKTCHC
jgi:hypothetical protein